MPPVGGGAAPAPVSIADAEIYDPTTGKFQSAGSLLEARDSHSATLLPDGTVRRRVSARIRWRRRSGVGHYYQRRGVRPGHAYFDSRCEPGS